MATNPVPALHTSPMVHELVRAAKQLDDALELLNEFCDKFYWIKDHADFQAEVRRYLQTHGYQPKPFGH